jgi:flagellar biosynthesis/type III secretory pathway chaperone
MDESKSVEERAGAGVEAELPRLWDDLVIILDTHLKNHRRLLSVLEKKKEACVEVRIADLEKAVAEERLEIEAIAGSERERIAATERLGTALGFPRPTRPRLLDLIGRAGEDHREALLDLRDELRDLAEVMDSLNRLNRTLVLHSLEHVHLFLVMLRGSDPEAKIYNPGGGEGGKADPILVDRRI